MQHATRSPVRRLRKATRQFIRRAIREERVGPQLRIEVDDDTADVRGADGRHAEESVAPAAQKSDALVEREQPRERALEIRRDRVKLPREVAALLSYPRGGGVEPVVVAGREVDDAVVESGAAG